MSSARQTTGGVIPPSKQVATARARCAAASSFEIGTPIYIGVFIFALATLAFQVLITRIFSVTLYYHFAFAGISLAMLGLTAGAMVVYLRPELFPAEKIRSRLAWLALLTGLSLAGATLFHLSVPVSIDRSAAFLWQLALHFLVFTIPFMLSGTAVSLILTRGVRRVGRLYAADLTGAAGGAVLVILLLQLIDVVSAIFVLTALLAVAGVALTRDAGDPHTRRWMRIWLAAALIACAGHAALVQRNLPHVTVRWAKNVPLERPLYEAWNSYSRVAVVRRFEDRPFGWGFSPAAQASHPILPQYYLNIDAEAGTAILPFDGDIGKLGFLEDDVVNVGYHVRPAESAAIVGVGGGRDVLSALRFGVGRITGIELNGEIVSVLNDRYGDFSGHLDRRPGVRFETTEARSYLAQAGETYDLIQISLIDTWAATAAGAYVLTENGLYTVEAWATFLRALSDDGILMTSRWWTERYRAEGYRLLKIAVEVLRREYGVMRPGPHVLVAQCGRIVTVMVSKAPFREDETARFQAACERHGFQSLWPPRGAPEPVVGAILSGRPDSAPAASLPFDISPPTDDRPFFFHLVRLKDAFRKERYEKLYGRGTDPVTQNINAIFVLAFVLAAVTVLAVLFIGGPLLATRRKQSFRGAGWHLLYFAAIGLGFFFIEISVMQRLMVFLGHPVFGLSVVLFSLLLFAGIGSLLSARIRFPRLALAGLLLVLVGFGVVLGPLLDAFRSQSTPIRIAVAIAAVAPLGGWLGICFPLGMSLAEKKEPALLPWFWGANGALSVVATVLATSVSLAQGISATYWAGLLCYAVCTLAYLKATALSVAGSLRAT